MWDVPQRCVVVGSVSSCSSNKELERTMTERMQWGGSLCDYDAHPLHPTIRSITRRTHTSQARTAGQAKMVLAIHERCELSDRATHAGDPQRLSTVLARWSWW